MSLEEIKEYANEGDYASAAEIAKECQVNVCSRCNGTGAITLVMNEEFEYDEFLPEDIPYGAEFVYNECPNCGGNGYEL